MPRAGRSAPRRLANGLFALLFPDECRLCGQPLREVSRVPVCRACLRRPEPLMADHFCACCQTPFLTPYPLDDEGLCGLCRRGWNGFDAAYTFGAYEETLRDLIHLFKYGRVRTLARPLGEYLASALPRQQRFDALVPMPMHWLRRWRRGFNQSRLLARHLARRTGLPLISPVRRCRATAPQTGMSNAGRRANVAGAFDVPRPASVRDLRLLLIDDVLTTGATASACAAALKKAGAAYVAVLTVARTDRRPAPETGSPSPQSLRLAQGVG